MTNNNRPRSRKKGEATSTSEVNKRDRVDSGRVGNRSYDRKPVRDSGRSSTGRPSFGQDSGYTGRDRDDEPITRGVSYGNRGSNYYSAPVRRRGGNPLIKILVFLLIAFMLSRCISTMLSSMSGTIDTPTQTQTPVQQNTTAATFNPPTTTYTDTTMTTADTTVADVIRDRFTTIRGNGQDKVTILIYICATDLESNYGMATNDINEMVYATHSDNVNILLQTGGTKRWRNTIMKTGTNERWKVTDRALIALDRAVGNKRMTDPNTLAEFIQWGTKQYPANRYMLILWDHGGGSVSGYGYDQVYPNQSMTLDKVAQALEAGGVKFDFIGFDACLMGNTETALVCSRYADYLIASEETEPGTGWYYTDWLTSLANNPSMSTVEIGKQIIDGFVVESAKSGRREKTSLAIIDLAEFQATVPQKLSAFAGDVSAALKTDSYKEIANARSVTKEFAQANKLDQIDVVHFCENINTQSAKELADAVKSCVKYNRVNNMTNAYGLSIYFPYRTASKVNAVAALYDNIGMEAAYTDAVRSFATLEGSGQIYSQGTSSSMFDLLGGSSSSNGQVYDATEFLNLLLSGAQEVQPQQEYSPMDDMLTLLQLLGGVRAIDTDSLENYANQIDRAHVDSAALEYSEVDGNTVLVLDEDQWSLINRLALNVWVDDGEGYIDLGTDNVFEFDDYGNLLAEYDNTWVSVNDHVAAYYVNTEEYPTDDTYVIEGYIPAMLNGEPVNLIVQFTEEDVYGTILGAQLIYEDGMEAKGLVEIQKGDELDFLCDYYDYNGNYDSTHLLGGTLVVGDDGVSMGMTKLDADVLYSYVLTDIYNAEHWTPMIRN